MNAYGAGRLPNSHMSNGTRFSQRPTYDEASDSYQQQPGYLPQKSRHSLGGSSRSRSRKLKPLEPILDELDDLIQDAMVFYRDFHQDFLRETQGIEAYASEDLLCMILTAKANAGTGPRNQHRRGSVRSTGMHASSSSDQTFHTFRRTLIEGIKRATAEIRYYESGHDKTPNLVYSQISKTYKAIIPALQVRQLSVSNLNTLATQLEMLSVFLRRHGAGSGQTRSSYDDGRDPDGYCDGDLQDDGHRDEQGDSEEGR